MIKTVQQLLLLTAVLLGVPYDVYANEPLAFKESGYFIKYSDPMIVTLNLASGVELHGSALNIDHETLSLWEETDARTQTNRAIVVNYSTDEGISVRDIASGKEFSLILIGDGEHPIDLASQDCYDNADTTLVLKECILNAEQAWDAELNRAYKLLGGSQNLPLKEAQRAWINYKEKQAKYLLDTYSQMRGSIWSIHLQKHLADVTREQATRLFAVYVDQL